MFFYQTNEKEFRVYHQVQWSVDDGFDPDETMEILGIGTAEYSTLRQNNTLAASARFRAAPSRFNLHSIWDILLVHVNSKLKGVHDDQIWWNELAEELIDCIASEIESSASESFFESREFIENPVLKVRDAHAMYFQETYGSAFCAHSFLSELADFWPVLISRISQVLQTSSARAEPS